MNATPRTDAACDFPSNDWEETATRIQAEAVKLETELTALRAEIAAVKGRDTETQPNRFLARPEEAWDAQMENELTTLRAELTALSSVWEMRAEQYKYNRPTRIDVILRDCAKDLRAALAKGGAK